MHSLPETFKNCKPIPSEERWRCIKCNSILFTKKLDIINTEFSHLKKFGITHKAVNFCSNPNCTFLEQGIIYQREDIKKFLTLDEIDELMDEIKDLRSSIRSL